MSLGVPWKLLKADASQLMLPKLVDSKEDAPQLVHRFVNRAVEEARVLHHLLELREQGDPGFKGGFAGDSTGGREFFGDDLDRGTILRSDELQGLS